ncbi:hypothetical protein [Halanaerobium congolense]|uniref:hypothetical protein n=1 Tax=Halanaerobium congolense TaxID=54121 RepID=UPI001060813C|nr:hypothetical protein [Halanaerobium congolense]TDP26845.1 hypothetical protein C8C79_10242 [Halanaerobium congolense]
MEQINPYNNLTDLEKEFILILGDHFKLLPQTLKHIELNKIVANSKDGKEIYEKFFKSEISKKEFIRITKNLAIKGFITTQDNQMNFINNSVKSGKEKLKNFYQKNEFNNIGFPISIRLTQENERTISGKAVYQYLVRREITNKSNEIMGKVNKLQNNFNSFYGRIVQIITIFIAIFSILIGNIGLFKFLENVSLDKLISLIFIINGTILMGIWFLIFLVQNMLLENKKLKFWWLVFIPLIFIVVGTFLYY